MAKKALIVWGGWDGHEPEGVSRLLGDSLKKRGVEVTISDTLDTFKELDLTQFDLIVPIWTMGTIEKEQLKPVLEAVRDHGVGIGGVHGGMCDSFRNETEWQLMTGGQWVAHPGNDGVEYTVEMNPDEPDPITEGVPTLQIKSEQYYMHIDPGDPCAGYDNLRRWHGHASRVDQTLRQRACLLLLTGPSCRCD